MRAFSNCVLMFPVFFAPLIIMQGCWTPWHEDEDKEPTSKALRTSPKTAKPNKKSGKKSKSDKKSNKKSDVEPAEDTLDSSEKYQKSNKKSHVELAAELDEEPAEELDEEPAEDTLDASKKDQAVRLHKTNKWERTGATWKRKQSE